MGTRRYLFIILGLITIVLSQSSCKKEKRCDECKSKIYYYKLEIEEILSIHASQHNGTNSHQPSSNYNSDLSDSEIIEIKQIEQGISQCENRMYMDCKKQFDRYDYKFYGK